MKNLILNADDFFLSSTFNATIIALIKEGCVSSTSVMIDRYNNSQKEQVVELKASTTGIGLHVEFIGAKNFNTEVQRQYELFIEVFKQEPSHLDIHKTDYLESGYGSIMEFAAKKNISFANHGIDVRGGRTTSTKSIGAIHNSLDEIVRWLESFNECDSGELVLHPGSFDQSCKTSLNYEREVDVTKARVVKKYCDDNGIKIISFLDL